MRQGACKEEGGQEQKKNPRNWANRVCRPLFLLSRSLRARIDDDETKNDSGRCCGVCFFFLAPPFRPGVRLVCANVG